MAENIRARAATRAEKIAHVLDDPEYRHVDPLEHGHAAPGVDQSKVLGSGHDDGPLERHLLRHGELGVPGAGRHIDHHHVERAPFDLAQHLRERGNHHRPAPNHCRLLVDEKADRHDGEAIPRDRLEPCTADRLWPLANRKKLRQRRAVNVGIEDAYFEAERT